MPSTSKYDGETSKRSTGLVWSSGSAARRLSDEHRRTARELYEGAAAGNAVVVQRLLAAIACVAFALAPSLHATRGDILATLKGTAPARSRLPLRSLLLGVQVAHIWNQFCGQIELRFPVRQDS